MRAEILGCFLHNSAQQRLLGHLRVRKESFHGWLTATHQLQFGRAGEYLALLDATGQPASEFSPQFPQQYADVSYGRYDSAGQLRYFSHPTPGAANDAASAYLGVVADVTFSVPRGYYRRQSVHGRPVDEHPWCDDTPHRARGMPKHDHRHDLPGSRVYLRYHALARDRLQVGLLAFTRRHQHLHHADRVMSQPAEPSGFPLTWGTWNGLPVPADYEMDPTVANDPRYQGTIPKATLRSYRRFHIRRVATTSSVPTVESIAIPFDLELNGNGRSRLK